MSKKRWAALGIAFLLLIVSLISQATVSMATNWDEMVAGWNSEYTEEVIKEGSLNKRIAVVPLEGVIQDDGEGSILSSSGYNHKRLLKYLDAAAEDDTVGGIIMRVNTPGGGVMESAEVHDKVVDIQKKHKKPVYVSMGNTAASGGYYVSAPAEKIVAHPSTLTGSIGVIMQTMDYSKLADDLGIDFNTIKSGKYKDILSPTRKMTNDERDLLQTIIDQMYGEFVKVIVDGRGMSESKVRKLGDGRVYTGLQAKKNGLVDELGSLDDTIALMKKDHKMKGAEVFQYDGSGFLGSWAGVTMQKAFGAERDFFGIREILNKSKTPRAMYLYTE
ncbi:signal peptide peptidase SppA [Aciduricibacillus chroicocephali]|uniref:Signal peptide peptidase SppA n=1 Tax=Aciduricibacillus chroicocephali TaxID=3054939 RepID=A0ABY9KXY8_9BACI|nr:signal peptide peptidase SppA [Bacillaceae bacterium 44XB]